MSSLVYSGPCLVVDVPVLCLSLDMYVYLAGGVWMWGLHFQQFYYDHSRFVYFGIQCHHSITVLKALLLR